MDDNQIILRKDISNVDFSDISSGERLPPVTPGEVLNEEFLRPLNLSARALGAAIGVPHNRITAIINGTRAITADTAIRLGAHFRMSPEFWLGLQMAHDLEVAQLARKPKAKRASPRPSPGGRGGRKRRAA